MDQCPLCGGKPVPIADVVGELVRAAILQGSRFYLCLRTGDQRINRLLRLFNEQRPLLQRLGLFAWQQAGQFTRHWRIT